MQANSNQRRHHLGALSCVLAALVALTGCGEQLQLVLTRGDDLKAAPPFIRFDVLNLAQKTVEQYGPYEKGSTPTEDFAEIPPGDLFLIDVIGCATADASKCVDPAKFLARGCTAKQKLDRGEQRTLEIKLHQATAPDIESCPEIIVGK